MKLRPCIAGPGISLHDAKGFAPNFSDARALPERTSAIDLGVSGPIGNWQTSFLFGYEIFPSHIMRFERGGVRTAFLYKFALLASLR
jgi:hypothetical protein